MVNKKLTILGDIHQKYDQMDKLNLKNHPVIQLGDLGFDYTYIYENYDPNLLKICLGNHDCYDNRPTEYDLGDFGLRNHCGWEFFFVRGGFSIDKPQRIEYNRMTGKKAWWSNEQLNDREREACLRQYKVAKPSVVFSHSCPASISEIVGKPGVLAAFGWPEDMVTPTQQLLQDMLEVHEPDLWVFGHYHRDWFYPTKNTDFICLNELDYIDFDEDWKIL